MTNLYFEELQIGIRSAAGPYPLSQGRDYPFRQTI
jgi:hypothetical protein